MLVRDASGAVLPQALGERPACTLSGRRQPVEPARGRTSILVLLGRPGQARVLLAEDVPAGAPVLKLK